MELYEQKRKEEICKQKGHIYTVETRNWAPYIYNVEGLEWEVEFCIRCLFGIPLYA